MKKDIEYDDLLNYCRNTPMLVTYGDSTTLYEGSNVPHVEVADAGFALDMVKERKVNKYAREYWDFMAVELHEGASVEALQWIKFLKDFQYSLLALENQLGYGMVPYGKEAVSDTVRTEVENAMQFMETLPRLGKLDLAKSRHS